MGKSKKRGSGGRRQPANNQILKLLPRAAYDAVEPWLEEVGCRQGEVLFEPGDNSTFAYFPLDGAVIALILPMRDGQTVEAANIGREGAIGGIVSLGHKPVYARGMVQIGGPALRVPVTRLEAAKRVSPKLHDILVRYADCLTAQILQSVGCAAVHPLQARCARWLLMMHDRLQRPDLPLTQEALAEMFGVARTYMTRTAAALQKRGAISYRRGIVHIERRAKLEEATCECYGAVRRHFERVQPGLYPTLEP